MTALAWLSRVRAAPTTPGEGRLALRRDETVRLRPRASGLVLEAQSGTIVVTQQGDLVDHVLTPGAAVRVPRGGVVVAWALSDASLTVTAPSPSRAARRAAAGASAPSSPCTDPPAPRPA
ncbi:MAG: DUF2917 domain-containing protein [Anaeromyxobacteraceae bacterium]